MRHILVPDAVGHDLVELKTKLRRPTAQAVQEFRVNKGFAAGKAKDSNVLWFGTQSNQSSLAPSIVVASQVYHWEGMLKEMISLIQKGALGGKTFRADLAKGGEVIEFNPGYSMPADAKTAADSAIKGITDGSIKITLP